MHYNWFCFIEDFNFDLINNLPKNTSVIYRNYSNHSNIEAIIKTQNICKKKKIKFYLANNIKLALNLNLDGVYIPAFNKKFDINSYQLKINFKILGSAHNIYEMRSKELQNIELIFLSSIFKKNKNFLGIYKFKLLSNLTKRPIIALGGISNNNFKKLNLINCLGFAGISFFE